MEPFVLDSTAAADAGVLQKMPYLIFQRADLKAPIVRARIHFEVEQNAITAYVASLVLYWTDVEDVTKIVVLEVIGQGCVQVIVVIGRVNVDVAAEEEKKGILTRPRSIVCFIYGVISWIRNEVVFNDVQQLRPVGVDLDAVGAGVSDGIVDEFEAGSSDSPVVAENTRLPRVHDNVVENDIVAQSKNNDAVAVDGLYKVVVAQSTCAFADLDSIVLSAHIGHAGIFNVVVVHLCAINAATDLDTLPGGVLDHVAVDLHVDNVVGILYTAGGCDSIRIEGIANVESLATRVMHVIVVDA